jgi:transcriptional antiterminator NusG
MREDLNKQISNGKLEFVDRFVCPTEKETKIIRNKKVTREKVLYGGYLYFETNKILNEDETKIISNIPNVMGMMGDKTPVLLRDHEIKKVLIDNNTNNAQGGITKYLIGETVNIIDGPFKSFEGKISELSGDKVFLEVKIFGRITNIELLTHQVQRI